MPFDVARTAWRPMTCDVSRRGAGHDVRAQQEPSLTTPTALGPQIEQRRRSLRERDRPFDLADGDLQKEVRMPRVKWLQARRQQELSDARIDVYSQPASDSGRRVSCLKGRLLDGPKMRHLLRQVEAIKTQGAFLLPISGDLKQPSVCTRDIAATAARLLLDRSWNGTGSVPVAFSRRSLLQRHGANHVGRPQQAGAFRAHRRRCLQDHLLKAGMSDAMAQATLDMWMAYDQGLDALEPRTRESTTPTSFRQWCEDILKARMQS